jgi:hypothetical protein
MPTDLLIATVRPSNETVFVEEAQIFRELMKRLAASAPAT